MTKKCVNCGIDYECYDKPKMSRGVRTKLLRGFNTITCSHACSKEYWRKRQNDKNNYTNERR